MYYFLTSNPIVFEKLDGRNSFADNVKEILKESLNLLYICSDPDSHEKNVKYANNIKTCFKNSGFKINAFDILDCMNKAEVKNLVYHADCIFLSGGHVPTQNKFFNEINLKEILSLQLNKIIIACSAGAMNCADTVYARPELEGEAISKYYNRFLEGLGITKTNIIPHYSEIKKESLDGLRIIEDITAKDSFGKSFFAISDGSYIYGNGKEEILYGEAFLIKDGKIEKISSEGSKYKIF